ncbi:hypothetical protein SAMN04487949_1559 [Halogranum gelatinilyticum]|uniref:DUF456 domain-containing protein n=1 Tax=Halogranum gelatinilyticum TaxID=660521 RepID=A0A1G9SZG4_9EURY|nr:DUF456 domain-containing protein [Halogranum gelatinilyticum]SDM40788.1 hypothetical protein SAMN04487949_1559 [Halogranum gelatinilyticum]
MELLALEPLALVALALLVVGVVGSVLPLVPGALASLAGVYLYWWTTGYAVPSLLVLAGVTVLGLVALVVDYFSGPIAARAGGASLTTTGVAALVGFALFFVAGPFGILLGIAGTVFAVEYYRNDDVDESLRTAAYATVGVLASSAVQLVLTASVLAVMLVVVFL